MRITFAVISVVRWRRSGRTPAHELHAQSKPPVYVVTEIAVRNIPATSMNMRRGHKKALRRRAANSCGEPQRHSSRAPLLHASLLGLDSPEQIAAWAHGPDYNEIRKIGERYAIFRSFAVEGLPR
jgi:hypothetical protein